MTRDPQVIEAFLVHEARLLDERRFEDWLGLFTDDGWYWVPIEPDQDNPHDTVSLIYDDRRLLETRIRRLAHPSIHAQTPPSRTSRIIANVTAEDQAAGGADVVIRSKFQMIEYRRDKQRLFAGTSRHGLVAADDGYRIRWKRVDLVNCDSMHDGINVPF
jgi:benzoate/toluate 1,2-dioxygenase beta subunit